jgi:hypothetical protein
MKKWILALTMTLTFNARAGFGDWFDLEKMFTGWLMIAESINGGLEKVRVLKHENLNIDQEWAIMCQANNGLKAQLDAAERILTILNWGTPACLPLTNSMRLQSKVMARCNDYYNKPVQQNFDEVLFASVEAFTEAQAVMVRCYPFIGDIGF